MGQCVIAANLGDGFYRVEILKETAKAVASQKNLESQIKQLTEKLAELQSDKLQQQIIVNQIADDVHLLITDLVDGSTAEEIQAVSGMTQVLQEESLKLQKINTEIAIASLAIASKTKAMSELSSVAEKEFRSVWCADLTDDLSAGDVHGTLEINRDNKTILIQPAGESQNNKLQPTQSSGPMTTAYNLAVLAAVQRDRPRYRVAIITNIDKAADTGTINLNPAFSSQQNININKSQVYSNVPIEYMDCNSAAFEDGDGVIVLFKDTPTVIGFLDNPEECSKSYFMFRAADNEISPIIEVKSAKKPPAISGYEYSDKFRWGLVDWKGYKGSRLVTITWKGPNSRYPMPSVSGVGIATDYFAESGVYLDGNFIKSIKHGYKTVGAAFKGENLVVFYLKDSVLSFEETDSDGNNISSGAILTEVSMLMQIVAVSEDGNRAVTIYNKVGDIFEPLKPVLGSAIGFEVDNYKRTIVDIDIANGYAINEEDQSIRVRSYDLIFSKINNNYRLVNANSTTIILAIDYKKNQRVTLTWSPKGIDEMHEPSYTGELMVDLIHEFRAWFLEIDAKEKQKRGGRLDLIYAEEFEITCLDLRVGIVAYTWTVLSATEIPDEFSPFNRDSKLFIKYKGITTQLGDTANFNWLINPIDVYNYKYRSNWLYNNFSIVYTYQRAGLAVDKHGNACLFLKNTHLPDDKELFFIDFDGNLVTSVENGSILTVQSIDTDRTNFRISEIGLI